MAQTLNLATKATRLANCVISSDGLTMRIQKLAFTRNLSQRQCCFMAFAKIGACRAIDRDFIENIMIANRKKIDDLV
ncbi:hypothetical protein [Campylobacter concisus]|uniref:hypothetical protein n=1 Tax=Campylobacter concisus TaxID=199 RepID=UPI00112FACEF|nr:hypothetical protein [Campylobacter concisus]